MEGLRRRESPAGWVCLLGPCPAHDSKHELRGHLLPGTVLGIHVPTLGTCALTIISKPGNEAQR